MLGGESKLEEGRLCRISTSGEDEEAGTGHGEKYIELWAECAGDLDAL